MKKRNLLYIAVPTSPFDLLPRLKNQNPKIQEQIDKEVANILIDISDLWMDYDLILTEFKKKYSVKRIFVNNMSIHNFKEDIKKKIIDKTDLGMSIDSLLKDDTTIELIENKDYLEFENYLLGQNLYLEYQIFNYLNQYIDNCHAKNKLVLFLSDYENGLNVINYPATHSIRKSVQGTAISDIRGKLSAEKINKSLKKGESGVAFLHAGDTSLFYFREKLQGVKLHENHDHEVRAYNLVVRLGNLLTKNRNT